MTTTDTSVTDTSLADMLADYRALKRALAGGIRSAQGRTWRRARYARRARPMTREEAEVVTRMGDTFVMTPGEQALALAFVGGMSLNLFGHAMVWDAWHSWGSVGLSVGLGFLGQSLLGLALVPVYRKACQFRVRRSTAAHTDAPYPHHVERKDLL